MMLKIWMGLLGLGLLVSSLCHAAAFNPDQAEEEWIYRQLDSLYQQGFIPNYPKEWVQSGNQLSRFEIAYYIKGIFTKDQEHTGRTLLPPSMVQSFQKLIMEFREELMAFGIKITDIEDINLKFVEEASFGEEYQDLDVLLKERKKKFNGFQPEPSYYLGHYYQSLQQKSFVFIPGEFVNPGDTKLLERVDNTINVVYPQHLGETHSMVVIPGKLPVSKDNSVEGYYLFPIPEQERKVTNLFDLEQSVLTVVDEVSRIHQIQSLWKFEGHLYFSDYLNKEIGLQTNLILGNINEGIKVGGILLFSQNPVNESFLEAGDFGLPFYEVFPNSAPLAVDLDKITDSSLESIFINIRGAKSLTPQTSIYGGLDLVYQNSEPTSLFDGFYHSNTKASAGMSYRMNNYWTLLTYQSFVNSQLKNGVLSTTSIGVDYDDWVTFWLAYQLLDFNDPVVTGALIFRF